MRVERTKEMRRRWPVGNDIFDTGLPRDIYGAIKRPTSWSRFYIERKFSMSGYTLSMLFGAAVLGPILYRKPETPVWLRIRRRLYRLPRWSLYLTVPFNRYWPGIAFGRKPRS